jgi:hypothetical protein
MMQKKTKISKTQKPHTNGYPVPYKRCHVCGGSGIIPMHIVNEELLKISSKNYGEDGVGLSSDELDKML